MLLTKATKKSTSIHDVNEIKSSVLTEVVGAIDMVEAAVRKSMEPDERCECNREDA